MCGIVGVLGREPVDGRRIEVMRDTLAHRGPDDAGVWRSPDGRVCLGHRRLAIIDLDAEANQPLRSTDGRFVITFNGEIYNYRALRDELEGLGVRIRTQSDTEVLLEAYRRWDHECLSRMSGMFAFAVWDTERNELFCARDRAGEKPFYYAELPGAFLFGSELKALAAWPNLTRRLDYTAVIDFLTFGFVPDPKAIWEGCHKLAPGHWMRVRFAPGRSPAVSPPVPYWDFTFSPDESVRDWSEPIRDTLMAAAAEMTVSDVPVGAFLSGGVDSSAVTAALARAKVPVRTFTIGFAEEAYDERPWARRVANQYRTAHTERVVSSDDVGAVFDLLLHHYDEPFGDYSYLPTYYLCREARAAITVALTGDGGDEVFAGYRRYQRVAVRERLRLRGLDPLAHGLAALGARLATGRAERTFRQYAAVPADAFTDMLSLGFTRDTLRAAARGPLAAALRHYDPQEAVEAHLRRAPATEVGLINAMRYLDLKLTLAGGILVKVDRASMAVALEVRPVFLHRNVLALAGRIPPGRLAGPRHAKGALKTALEPWLPRDLLYRRKQGFALPLPQWLARGQGPGLIAGATGSSLGNLLDPARIAALGNEHRGGQANRAGALYNVALLEQWLTIWQ